MPGKHITHQQEAIYMKNRQIGHGQETAAAKAGVSIRSGRRIEKGVRVEKSQTAMAHAPGSFCTGLGRPNWFHCCTGNLN